MTNTKHTKGPWTAHNMVGEDGKQMTPEEIGEYVCNSVKMGSPDRFLFIGAKHDDGGDCDVCHVGNGPKGPANARLIAAAPELLEALEALRACIMETRGPDAHAACEAADAAIAKAKGETT